MCVMYEYVKFPLRNLSPPAPYRRNVYQSCKCLTIMLPRTLYDTRNKICRHPLPTIFFIRQQPTYTRCKNIIFNII